MLWAIEAGQVYLQQEDSKSLASSFRELFFP